MSNTTPPPPPSSPAYNIFEDLLLRGVYDQNLAMLELAILRRKAQLAPTRATLRVGDRVKLNDQCRPQYMQGAMGTVLKVNQTTAYISFDETRGRFKGGRVKCPFSIIDKI